MTYDYELLRDILIHINVPKFQEKLQKYTRESKFYEIVKKRKDKKLFSSYPLRTVLSWRSLRDPDYCALLKLIIKEIKTKTLLVKILMVNRISIYSRCKGKIIIKSFCDASLPPPKITHSNCLASKRSALRRC